MIRLIAWPQGWGLTPIATELTVKPLVPSTPGEVSFVVRRERGWITFPKHFAKFSSVREEANRLIRDWDTEDNHVVQVEVNYTFPVERQWTKSPRTR